MRKDDIFLSDRLFFRGINAGDADCLVSWRSDAEIIQYFENSTPLTKQSHIHWFYDNYIQDQRRFDYIIIEKASKRNIGFIGVKNIVWSEKTGEIMYAIAERQFRRLGYATEAISALLNYIRPNITFPYAVIHTDNIASIRTIAAAGFELECRENASPFARYRKDNRQ